MARNKRKTSRTTQRQRAMDVLFEADEKGLVNREDLLSLLSERQALSTAQVPIGAFGSQIVEAYADNIFDVDPMVEASSHGWALSRMNVVDRTILRLAAAELMYVGTERALVVTEWAGLAREFSTDRSIGFVMGIINRVADIKARERGEHVLTQREREDMARLENSTGEEETLAALKVNDEDFDPHNTTSVPTPDNLPEETDAPSNEGSDSHSSV